MSPRQLDSPQAGAHTAAVVFGDREPGAVSSRLETVRESPASTRTPRRPETPSEREARRKAWGREWATVAREIKAEHEGRAKT